MNLDTLTWVLIGIVLFLIGTGMQFWLRVTEVIKAKNSTIESLRSIIRMQRDTLNELVHNAWAQAGDKRGTRLMVELDAATWRAVHQAAALSDILLSDKPTNDKGEQTDGP